MSRIFNLVSLEVLLFTFWGTTLSYVLFKFFHLNLMDEWIGRGLYPGLAFFNGLDFYEPDSGPHVTLYGWATGLFYMLSGFGSDPDDAALIAYCTNLLSVFFVLFALYRLCFYNSKSLSFRVVADSVALVALSLAVAFLDPTTESLFRIHADTPALVFLLLSIVLLKIFCDRKNQILLFLSALCLCLSFWAKLPTLPACILPAIFFATNGKWKSFVLFLLHLTVAFIITLAFVAIFYGVNDSKFILLDHISQNKWSDRNSLFYGKGAGLLQMNYFEAIPLLFRFFVMYIEQYWIIIIGVIGVFSLSFSKNTNPDKKFLLLNLSFAYFLTLPSCLSALAHFGSVENSLFFTNFIGILCIIAGIHCFLTEFNKTSHPSIFIWSISLMLILPTLRVANSISISRHSPHQQAFEYLQAGNQDVFFGWYPISHLMANDESYTSIEVPTWVSMTKPNDISFSKKHFPPKAEFLATCKIGYGGFSLQRYLGKLEEVESNRKLSHWRLFKIAK